MEISVRDATALIRASVAADRGLVPIGHQSR
jgi:hypothetical protein